MSIKSSSLIFKAFSLLAASICLALLSFASTCSTASAVSPLEDDEEVREELRAEPEEVAELAEESSSRSEFKIAHDIAHSAFLEASSRYVPELRLSTYYIPGAGLDGQSGRFDELEYGIEALLPLTLTEDTQLLLGTEAEMRNFKFGDRSGLHDETLYNVSLRIGARHFFSEDFLFQAYWEPGIYSDFDGSPYADDWRLEYGQALTVYRANKDLFLKVGLEINHGLDLGVIPLLGFAWELSPRWKLDVLAPKYAQLSYFPTEVWDLHIGAEADFDKYTIRQDDESGEYRRNIIVQDWRIFVGSIRKFEQGISAFWRYGLAIGGEYDWGSRYEGRMEAALFLQGGLGLDF